MPQMQNLTDDDFLAKLPDNHGEHHCMWCGTFLGNQLAHVELPVTTSFYDRPHLVDLRVHPGCKEAAKLAFLKHRLSR